MRKRKFNLCLSLLLTIGIAISQFSPIVAQQDEVSDTPTETTQVEEFKNDAEAENTETFPGTENPEEVTEPATTDPTVEVSDDGEEETELGKNKEYPSKKVSQKLNGVLIEATFDFNSGLPENAVLNAEEIKESGSYNYYLNQADAVTNGEVTFARFFDIHFKDENGNIVQPENGSVAIKITYDKAQKKEENEDVSVVHFPEWGGIEVIENAKIDQTDTALKSVTLDATNFSVYGIVGDETPVHTYTFYIPSSISKNGEVAGYEEYEYTDKAGNKVSTQYVENDGIIIDPGTPTKDFGEFVFDDWYFGETNGGSITLTNQPVNFDSVVAVSNKRSIPIVAKYSKVQYATFFDNPEGTIVLGKIKVEDGKINIGDLQAVTPESNKAFEGWKLGKDSSQIIQIDKDGYYTLENDEILDFYPVFTTAYTIEYSTGFEGSYIAPSIVFEGKNTVEPTEIPHRNGYKFDGWYTSQDKDENGTGEKFRFGSSIDNHMILFAGWIPDRTSYRIVVWQQQASDDKSWEDNQKTYAYVGSETRTANTGSTVQLPNTFTQFGNQNNQTIGGEQFNFIGFRYNGNNTEKSAVVNGDGSTTLNVFYDRNPITITFKGIGDDTYTQTTQNTTTDGSLYGTDDGGKTFFPLYVNVNYGLGGSTYTYYRDSSKRDRYSGQRYKKSVGDLVFTGLYGQPFEKYNYKWPGNYLWKDSNRPLSFLGQFVLPENKNTELTLTQTTGTSYTAYFYLENIDGTYPEIDNPSDKSLFRNKGFGWNFTNKYYGFQYSQYKVSRDGDWNNITGDLHSGRNGDIYIRYSRNSYDVEFYNGMISNPGNILDSQSFKYQASLNGINKPNVGFPGHESDSDAYEFVGWFADPECTKYLMFNDEDPSEQERNLLNKHGITSIEHVSAMPYHNVAAYAGWFKKKLDVTFNLAGGQLADKLDDKITVNHGSQIPDPYFINENLIYKDHSFVGWAKTDSIASGNYEYWSPKQGVTEPTELTAIWKSTGNFSIQYKGGSQNTVFEELSSDIKYADRSLVNLPTPPENSTPDDSIFLGWKVISNQNSSNSEGNILQPGQSFTIDAANMASNGIVTVEAVYGKIGTTAITYHANNGTNETKLVSNIAINTNISGNNPTPILSIEDSGFKNEGKVFKGWNTLANGQGTFYYPGNSEYAVNGDPSQNNLYAIWTDVYTVTIKKAVNGNFGDRLKQFDFNLVVTDEDGKAVDRTFELTGAEVVNGNHNFKLRNTGELVIAVPKGYHVAVRETSDLDDYDTSITVNDKVYDNSSDEGFAGNQQISERTTILFTNSKDGTVPTGINDSNILIYLTMTIAALGFAILYVLNFKRRNI